MIEMTPNEVFIQRIKCQNYRVCDELLEKHDNQIREEAFNEFARTLNNSVTNNPKTIYDYKEVCGLVHRVSEQLKEQTE